MRKLILLCLFINSYSAAFNQVVNGTVLDKVTKNSIGFATVYFNGTYVGTSADQNGNFELNISKNASMPLTISAIGYYSVTLTDFSKVEPLIIYLSPKVYELHEAVISAKSLERIRKRNLILFKEEFLGTTENAQYCEILSEKDITFNYYSQDDTLKAYALKPIIIDNKALGYTITCYLDKFEYYRTSGSVFYVGNMIFKENGIGEGANHQFDERRKNTYLGSRVHFLRTLWSDDLFLSDFIVRDAKQRLLDYKSIVIEEGNDKFIQYPKSFCIVYDKSVSFIYFLKQKVFFDKVGHFDPSGINWKGKMGDQRIADSLPDEYILK